VAVETVVVDTDQAWGLCCSAWVWDTPWVEAALAAEAQEVLAEVLSEGSAEVLSEVVAHQDPGSLQKIKEPLRYAKGLFYLVTMLCLTRIQK